MNVVDLRHSLYIYINNPLILVLLVAAILVFLWGLVRFLGYLGSDAKEGGNAIGEGKRHMLWGIVGFFIIASAAAIIDVTIGTFGAPPVESITPPSSAGSSSGNPLGCPYGVDSQGICNHGPAGQAPY